MDFIFLLYDYGTSRQDGNNQQNANKRIHNSTTFNCVFIRGYLDQNVKLLNSLLTKPRNVFINVQFVINCYSQNGFIFTIGYFVLVGL